LDTVRLIPHRERGILLYRGVLKVREDDARDVLDVVAACEAMGEPKTVEHYETVLAQRKDKKKRHLYALRDRDLMPALDGKATPLPDDQLFGVAALLKREDFQGKRMSRQREKLQREQQRHIEEAKNVVRSQGLNPELYFPSEPATPPTTLP